MSKALAEELTERIHSKEDLHAVAKVSELLFNKKASKETLLELTESAFETISQEIPFYQIEKSEFDQGLNIVELLSTNTQILSSKGDVRRALKNNAIAVNKEKIQDHEASISSDYLLHDRFIMIENVKKNKILVEAI